MAIKDFINKKKKEFNDWEDKYEDNKKKEKERRIEKILAKHDVFKGIDVTATFPQQELRLKSHGGVTRGLATLGFGVVGLAATNNVKQEKKNVVLDTVFQIVERGVVFKNATDDGKDLRVPYEDIVDASYENLPASSSEFQVNIRLLENQFITFVPKGIQKEGLEPICSLTTNTINERAKGSKYEEGGWGLESSSDNAPLPKETMEKSKQSSSMEELEKLMNMYEKGLLTDDEFAAMKKKIIEN